MNGKKLTAGLVLVTGMTGLVGVTGSGVASAKTPISCEKALDAAEEIVSITKDVTGAVGTYFKDKGTAAKAATPTLTGVTAFINEDTRLTNVLTAAVTSASGKLDSPLLTYQINSAKCRKG